MSGERPFLTRKLTKATMLNVAEWGAALAFASVGTPANLEWRMVACGLIAAMSISRVRREMAAPAAATAAAPAHTPTVVPASAQPADAPPVERPALIEPLKGASSRTSIAVPSASAGSVLLAEDDPNNQTLVATQLRRLSYTVTIAGNGRAAVDLAIAAECAGEPFDIILMDMQMPEMDGYTATRELRKRKYQGSIVALTAHAVEGDREKCIDAGCDEYLTKPINRPKLLAAIRDSVGLARAAMENAATSARRLTLPDSCEPLVSEFANDPDIADILSEFVRLLGDRAMTLTSALARNDLEALKRVVHQLKGAAGGYGFPSITEQAKVVEDAVSQAGDAGELKKAVDSLTSLCFRAGFKGDASRPKVA
jgi:CheY-like chemotaxis protein/HPt (histidine-containing phosphotransfer) domain-containing protein